MRAEEKKRLGRLAGTAEGGGGLQLPSLFRAILNELLDNGSAETARIAEITEQTLAGQSARMRQTWGTWPALTDDVVAQMEHKGIIKLDGGERWVTGDQFHTGIFLEIVPTWNGQPPDGTIVWPQQERQERDASTHALRSYAELDARVVSHGFRGVTQARLSLIRESMETLGDLRRYFPVLTDEQGNVIDGRHRRTIDPSWPASATKVDNDDRVVVALAANQTNPWTAHDWDRLREQAQLTRTRTQAGRFLTRLALLEDATRSNRQIADLVTVGDQLVRQVREELRDSRNIHHYEFTAGRGGLSGGKPGKHSASCWCGEGDTPVTEPRESASRRKISEAELDIIDREDLGWRQIMERFGVRQSAAQSAKTRVLTRREERQRLSAETTVKPEPQPVPDPDPEPQAEQEQPEHIHNLITQTRTHVETRVICDECGDVVQDWEIQ